MPGIYMKPTDNGMAYGFKFDTDLEDLTSKEVDIAKRQTLKKAQITEDSDVAMKLFKLAEAIEAYSKSVKWKERR